MAKVVDTPVVAPGSCYMCGCSNTQDREWWMDTEKYAEEWGNIYYCDQCFKYMVYEASQADLANIDNVDELVTLRRRNTELDRKARIYESVLRPLYSSDILSLMSGALDTPIGILPENSPERPVPTEPESPTAEREPEEVIPGYVGTGEEAVATIVGDFNLDIPAPTQRFDESFDDPQLGSLPIIASEFGVDEGPDKGFSVREP